MPKKRKIIKPGKRGHAPTERQKSFCHNLFDNKMTQGEAYKAAGYSANNHKHAATKAWSLKQIPHVAAYLDELNNRAVSEAVLGKQEAMEILSAIARGQVKKYVNDQGRFIDGSISESGADLASVELIEHEGLSTSTTRRKIKMNDPVKAIERLARLRGWDKEQRLDIGGVTFVMDTGDDETDDVKHRGGN